ncbi:MAG: c-type cytochrome, partial [Rhodoferax sp.]
YYPRLAGKPAGYLYQQLRNFSVGRRHYAPMTALIDTLDDAYLQAIANHFSALSLPYPAPTPPSASAAVLQRGKDLATEGDRTRALPACTQCHGNALTGVAPNVPGLLGLPRDYLSAQLGGWRTGQRSASAPDCMAEVAHKLGLDEVNAVAHWLAAQPVPTPATPARAFPRRDADAPTLRCGSAPDLSPPGNTTAAAPPAAMPVAADATVLTTGASSGGSVARGAYLARVGNCALCHTARGGAAYSGGKTFETPFGTVVSGNITPDSATGIGAWSSEDFWRALHHGESRNGRLLYPVFPYTNYTHVSRADSDALFAYLSSLPPVTQRNAEHRMQWPFGTRAALALWRALYFTADATAATRKDGAATGTLLQRGAYLVSGLGHCSACHASRNLLGAIGNPEALGGGVVGSSGWYAPALGRNSPGYQPDRAIADTVLLLKSGRTEQFQVSGPMAEVVRHSTQYLDAEDARAIAEFLDAQAPLRPPPFVSNIAGDSGASAMAQGASLYQTHCAKCHGKQGQGQAGAYPALAGNHSITQPQASNAIQLVLHGGFAPTTVANPRPYGMPPFQLHLSSAQIASVLSYVRAAWGNTAAPVTELDVNLARGRAR